jgi:hypothetical protein
MNCPKCGQEMIDVKDYCVNCGAKLREEKMVSTITQDYFETEQGLEQLIVGTYDALRVTKQYEQGPASLMAGVDNFSQKTASRGMYSASEWNATGQHGI